MKATRHTQILSIGILVLIDLSISVANTGLAKGTNSKIFKEQNSALLKNIGKTHDLSEEEAKNLQSIFDRSGYIGQGNPEVTQHPMTSDECHTKVKSANANYDNSQHEKICGDKYMAPLYDPKTSTPTEAKVCIDKFEFPNIPCEYPVVWVQANEAAQICNAIGKRLCDAHEWEGACAGDLQPPNYDFDLVDKMGANKAVQTMRQRINSKESKNASWSYGKEYKKGICATNSTKSQNCSGEGWKKCGSNTYPIGSFPECKSSLDVYDINGNAAEHMNLPLKRDELASVNKNKLGYTEMKGSWFIFDKYRAHEDYCRWRAPFWHGSKVMDAKSHHNYHLGFRCCKDITP